MYVLYFVDVKDWKRRTAWAKGRGEYNSLACDYSLPHCSLLPELFGRDEAFSTKGSDERQLYSQANKRQPENNIQMWKFLWNPPSCT